MSRFASLVALAVLLAFLAIPVAGDGGHSAEAARRAGRNPFGITMVKFAPGVKAPLMRAAITAAGGDVTSDLSKIHTMAAVPLEAGFEERIAATSGVVAVWQDRVFQSIGPDAAADGITGKNEPALGSPGADSPPDPWHDLPSFLGETNPEGILQWDDNRMDVPDAWETTTGDPSVKVAVLDTGVQGSHKELLPNYDNQNSANTVPCSTLVRDFGNDVVKAFGLRDCSSEDKDGHGTWVSSRIAGAANGFASNGVAPNVQVMGFKVLAVDFGGLTSWIVDAMIRACDADADLINMSLGGYNDPLDTSNPFHEFDALDTLVWKEAVDYCRAAGTAIFASAGNEHVRIHRTNVTILGVPLNGVGRVDAGDEGISSVLPGTTSLDKYVNDLRGMIQVPAGIPGVAMVSATNNAIGPAGPDVPAGLRWPAALTGAQNQLTYYSNYGSRIDVAAPGGARKFNIPRVDGGPGDILYGGWGTLGATDPSGDLCRFAGGLLTFACFKVNGAGFAWLQGTSMSSPNATGVAALTLAAHPTLQGNPTALLARLQSTARTDMTNYMGPNDPTNTAPSYFGVPCTTGWCHLDFDSPIPFSDAYGAGMVDAEAAVGP